MTKIGNFVRPEDNPWHHLRVEGFGQFTVQAEDPDAAWQKLSYFCIEMGMGYDPEQQLGMLHSDTTMPPRLTVEHNRARFLAHNTDTVMVDHEIENGKRPLPQPSDYALGKTATLPNVL